MSHTHNEQNHWKPAAGYVVNEYTAETIPLRPASPQTGPNWPTTYLNSHCWLTDLEPGSSLEKTKKTKPKQKSLVPVLNGRSSWRGRVRRPARRYSPHGPKPSQSHLCPLLPNRAIEMEKGKRKKPTTQQQHFLLFVSWRPFKTYVLKA